MHIRSLSRVILGLIVIIWSVAAASDASAAIRTWTGAGGTNLWMTAANWQGSQLPQAGDALQFPAGAMQTASFNNFPANTTFAQLTFFANYQIGGNALGVTAIIDAAQGTVVDIYMPVTLASASGTPVFFAPDTAASLTFHNVISGATGFTEVGDGTVTLEGPTPNTFTGVATVNAGLLVLQQTTGPAIPAGLIVGDGAGGPQSDIVKLTVLSQIAGDVTVTPSGLLDLNGFGDTIGALTITSGRVQTGNATLTLGGNVTVPDGSFNATIAGGLSLGAATRTFNIGNGGIPALDVQALVSGTTAGAGLVKAGIGWLRLSGNNSYGGVTTIQSGPVIAASASAFGSPGTETIVLNQGSVHFDSNVDTLEPLVAHTDNTLGALYCDGSGVRGWHGTITLVGTNQFYSTIGCTLQLETITGNGDLVVGNFGDAVELILPNDYTGQTRVLSGTLRLKSTNAIPVTSDVTLINATLDTKNVAQNIRSLQGSGQVLLGTGNLSVMMTQNTALTFSGVISGTGAVAKTGPGHWTLTGQNSFAGGLYLNGGSLTVDGAVPGGVALYGGSLFGTGTIGLIQGASGHVQAGYSGVPGVLKSTSVMLDPGITFGATVNGAAVGTQYSQLAVTGTVNLNGAPLELNVSPGFLPAGAGALVLIDNDGSDPIVGTFAGLAEGAVINGGNGKQFRVSYAGGTGNDVTLTPLVSPYYLSEGATGSFFDTDVLIANPNDVAVPITIKFLKDDATTVTQDLSLPATSRTTIRVDDIPGMEATAFSTIVTSNSGAPLVVERTMRWDTTGYGGHTEKAVAGAAPTWYFAEGSQGFFSTFLLLANPQTSASTATVQYLVEGGPVVVRTYSLQPLSRLTVDVGGEPALVSHSFGMIVSFSAPGVAERAMYFGTNPLWTGGHESAGETMPATTWYVAEGATGSYFTTFILLSNPGGTDVQATVTFLPDTGVPVTKIKTVPANGRLTLNIAGEDPSLANAAVATTVTTAGAPILVERSQYWPFTPDRWQEAHNSFGVSALGTKWGLAEGRVGGPEAYQTYILLANPGALPANVAIKFLRDDGTTVTKPFVVAPTSRLNVPVGPGTGVPELSNERFGAVLASDQPIAVERAMYWDANGIVWAAGTSATATRLP